MFVFCVFHCECGCLNVCSYMQYRVHSWQSKCVCVLHSQTVSLLWLVERSWSIAHNCEAFTLWCSLCNISVFIQPTVLLYLYVSGLKLCFLKMYWRKHCRCYVSVNKDWKSRKYISTLNSLSTKTALIHVGTEKQTLFSCHQHAGTCGCRVSLSRHFTQNHNCQLHSRAGGNVRISPVFMIHLLGSTIVCIKFLCQSILMLRYFTE